MCVYVIMSPEPCVLRVVQVPWPSVRSSPPLGWEGMLLNTSEDMAQGIFTPHTTKHLGSRGWWWKKEPVLLRRPLDRHHPVPPKRDGLRFGSQALQSQQQSARARCYFCPSHCCPRCTACQFQLSGLLSRKVLGNEDLPPFKYQFTQE